MKKGPVSKAELFYVSHNREKSVTELAEDLDRSETLITKLLVDMPEPEQEQEEVPAKQPDSMVQTIAQQNAKNTGFNRKVIRKAVSKGRISHPSNPNKTIGNVMNPAVSQLMDEQRHNNAPSASRVMKESVFKPFKDDDVKPNK